MWTGPCWQGCPVLPLSWAGPPWPSSPLGPQMANQDTRLTPRVLEVALSCCLQAPAECSSSCWSGLWGRSESLWIQMHPPSLWAIASPPFSWGLPVILGVPVVFFWQTLPFPSVGSLAPSCWSLLLCESGRLGRPQLFHKQEAGDITIPTSLNTVLTTMAELCHLKYISKQRKLQPSSPQPL